MLRDYVTQNDVNNVERLYFSEGEMLLMFHCSALDLRVAMIPVIPSSLNPLLSPRRGRVGHSALSPLVT